MPCSELNFTHSRHTHYHIRTFINRYHILQKIPEAIFFLFFLSSRTLQTKSYVELEQVKLIF